MSEIEDFKSYLIEPFKDMFMSVIEQLSAQITGAMEIKRNLFSRILKNDFGRGIWIFLLSTLPPN